jgi:hypothetical protein
MAQQDRQLTAKAKKIYEQLRDAGLSKKKSVRVAKILGRPATKPATKKATKRAGAHPSYEKWKVADLRNKAKQAGVPGRSTMTKKQLVKALRAG